MQFEANGPPRRAETGSRPARPYRRRGCMPRECGPHNGVAYVRGKPARGSQSTHSQTRAQSQPGGVKAPQLGSAAQSSIVRLGIPSLLFAQGFALLPLSFWAGISCMSLALVLSWWALFRVFHRGERLKRLAGVIGTAMFCSFIVWDAANSPSRS